MPAIVHGTDRASLLEIVSDLSLILDQDAKAMLSLLAGSTFFFVVDFFGLLVIFQ